MRERGTEGRDIEKEGEEGGEIVARVKILKTVTRVWDSEVNELKESSNPDRSRLEIMMMER